VMKGAGLKAERRAEVDARAGADAVRDDEVEAEECGGEPHAAAEAAFEVLIREPLAFVVDRPDVNKRADAGLADQGQRRRPRREDFGAASDERVADGRSRSEAAKVVHAAEHRTEIRRQRDVRILTLRANDEDVLPVESDVPAAVEVGSRRACSVLEIEVLDRG